jgi:hypothetical protein
MAVVNSSRFNLKEGIETAIMKYLDNYSDEVIKATEETVVEIAQESVKKLKEESPKRAGNSKHKYSKGWTYELDRGRLRTGAVIYGKKGTYNLAHLLEYGHVLRNGGRKVGEASARPHIKKVEEWAIEEFEKRLIDKIGG